MRDEISLIISNGIAKQKIRNRKTDTLIFYVNGKRIVETNPDPEQNLLWYLREKLRLCGTKLACGEGGCGACTVMISKYDRNAQKVKHFAINACLMPTCAVHGLAVTTVEGIGSTRTKLHPVQERIAKAHGSQCGFCTPGMVMSMYALLRSLPHPTMEDLETAFQGNLCRCTGYRPILEGYRTFIDNDKSSRCGMGELCCKIQNNSKEIENQLFERNEFMPYDPTQEPIFPPELKMSINFVNEFMVFKTSRVTWFRPTNLRELLTIKLNHPQVRIVTGNTEVGVEVKFKKFHYPYLATPVLIPELNAIQETAVGISVGSAVTLHDLETKLNELIRNQPEHTTRIYKSIVEMLHYFAGKQIRNVASIGGNIMTGSPISDLNPILMASGVLLSVSSARSGERKIIMDDKFFTGYRKNILADDEILTTIFIPQSRPNQHFVAYKQAKRRDDDIAIVNAAINVTFTPGTDVIESIQMAFGGMASTTVMAVKAAENAIGLNWDQNMVEIINDWLIEELPLSADAPGGMIQYRQSLTLSLFFKAYLKISEELQQSILKREKLPENFKSGATAIQIPPPKSSQIFEIPNTAHSIQNPVGLPRVHLSAFKQATGEAVYCDDIPHYENELYLSYVLSTKAYANIRSIDASEALTIPGVVAFFSAKDLTPEQNKMGIVVKDEEVFISKTTTSQGQILGAIVAESQSLAQKASSLVDVDYEELSPIIVSIEDAIKYNSFLPDCPKIIVNGNVNQAFEDSDYVFEGVFRMGGQEHFYMETNVSLAAPKDPDELEIISSSQFPRDIQNHAANTLGIPASRIVVKTKRLGGGFGGKETKSVVVALPIAIAAHRLNRPVRCMLDRDEDMIMTGYRHPFLFKYKAGCTKDGQILACDLEIYINGGYSTDLSEGVLLQAMVVFSSAYYIPNVRVQGWICRTNLPSNTAFRGFGNPQGMMIGEIIVRRIADHFGMDLKKVIELNLYKDGQLTICNQKIEGDSVQRCWHELLQKSDYENRLKDVQKFNELNRWKKRGITVVPLNYGIAILKRASNQAGALIHIYMDGSVLVAHGGTEMGQGLNTKMIQVASHCLNVPIEKMHIGEMSTDKIPNSSATAASVSSDINGMAVLNACEKILKRLEPIKLQYPEGNWDSWITVAYLERVSLSATGFYATPDLEYDIDTNQGRRYDYFTQGAACTEVEIDCLTGDHQLIRTDIVMDIGASLNPAIDIGQIEGGFMQGYGLFTIEELIVSPTGTLYSRGPGMYKIPAFSNIPPELNVSLLTGSSNPRAVYSSKGVGEPPLCLATSVFLAIKDAIKAARKDENLTDEFNFASPATSARIRMACEDKFTRSVPKLGEGLPWNVMP